MTAYQITSMMEGVVQRGTATTLLELNRPIAGKTGTTNDEKDAWFIGFTPNLVVGLYVGFDQPQTLGKGTTGGGLAAPIFKEFMAEALKDTPPASFQVPEGMNLIAINRKTGMRANEGEPGTIMEAFKPGTGPADSYWVIGMDAGGEMGESLSPPPTAPSRPAAAGFTELRHLSSIRTIERRLRSDALRSQAAGWAGQRSDLRVRPFLHQRFTGRNRIPMFRADSTAPSLHLWKAQSSHARGNRKTRRRNQAGA